MKSRSATILTGATIIAGLAFCPNASHADESGMSFWLPGLYGSLAATPATPGWSIAAIYYHTTVSASGAAAAAREAQIGRFSPNININLNVNLNARADLALIAPTYTFASPVLGGQMSMTLAGVYGRSAASIAGTLTATAGPLVLTRTGSLDDTLTSFGDLYPMATLKWNTGVHNYMTYLAGDIPVGVYSSTRLANVGIGHGAIDAAAATPSSIRRPARIFSVAGFTYNFKNTDTQYQNGIDFHFDWGVSQFLTKQIFVGFVGYGYQQLTDDFGARQILGGFRSRVFGIGPQLGYLFPVGDMQGYLNLKAYGEFAAENRPSGWNTWLTFSISEAAPKTVTPSRRSITK